MGDFVKGRHPEQSYSAKVAQGIQLHRRIDVFTDSHPIVRESKLRLRPTHRHYSGVIVDIFYDHFLASQWMIYHNESLSDYADCFYRYAMSRHDILPTRAAWVLEHMAKGDWLSSYCSVEGIGRVMRGMARRTRFESGMETATNLLEKHYDEFRLEFGQFFPELIKNSASSFSENHQII